MIVPEKATDDLGQEAKASITFLRYSLTLRLIEEDRKLAAVPQREGSSGSEGSLLQIESEELTGINLGDAAGKLLFPHSPEWRKSVIKGRRSAPLISTEPAEGGNLIKVHQDGRQGRALRLRAASLPRTVLSASNAAENPTILAARREMQSWRLLQLEPSALRKPDEFTAPTRLATDGRHLPATLFRLAYGHTPLSANGESNGKEERAERVYAQVANRLSELIDDLRTLRVDRDIQRELLTLYATSRDGTAHPARSLSDGTLRFLALAVLEMDPQAQGVICLEEPENGIHPSRIPSMLRLLQDIACDTSSSVGEDNPLRQVIVNTHSPSVVAEVPEDSLLVARLVEQVDKEGRRYTKVQFAALPDTWRSHAGQTPLVKKGELLSYLSPIVPSNGFSSAPEKASSSSTTQARRRRVVDRPDLQPYLFPSLEPIP
ncbi:MAG: AAA family ATPase [Thermoflexales bacterium]|nr:AAA family ATPase [Thermoflexales bacterium]